MSKLAVSGGEPVRSEPFPFPNFIEEEEKKAAREVLDSGHLSRFLGSWHEEYFYGGPRVREFEEAWAAFTETEHAVSVNSNTSGLLAAVGAAGVGPGDEVIVPPWTMSATATAVVAYNGVPIFADILDDIFCLDPEDVEEKITPSTKAIIAVDLFGHPADLDPLLDLARRHDLVVIEDAAQAPGAVYRGQKLGGISHMTVFSLNCHKHIQTGEGGVVTTDDAKLAERLRLIRNHGESVVEGKGVTDLVNAFGFNLRYTELHAAIGTEQLRKLPRLLDWRIENADYLSEKLDDLPGISVPEVRDECRHVYYVQPFLFDAEEVGVSRDRFIEAVAAELPSSPDRDGAPLIWTGYVTPLYLLPMYRERTAYRDGSPFEPGSQEYAPGLCPVTESLQDERLFMNDYIRPPATLDDMGDVVRAFEKVEANLDELS